MTNDFIKIERVGETRFFNLAEAQELFPLVKRITDKHYKKLLPVQSKIEKMLSNDPRRSMVEQEYEAIVMQWKQKVERLGLVTKGLWLVDFDVGDGYLCWKYPELEIAYFHDYDAGFSGRRRLSEVIEELDPDWAL